MVICRDLIITLVQCFCTFYFSPKAVSQKNGETQKFSLIIEYVCISSVADTNKIYEISQKYQSEYVTVSENNSPIFSIIIFTVVSFILHYFIIKKVSTEKL